MDSHLQSQDDLEKYWGSAFPPFDPDDLESMLEASRQLQAISPIDQWEVERLTKAIEQIGDVDYRDMFRRESVKTLASFGRWNEARYMAGQAEVPAERFEILLSLAMKLFAANRPPEALELMAQFVTAVYQTGSEEVWQWQRVMLLDEAAGELLRTGFKTKAQDAWEKAIQTAQAERLEIDEDVDIALQNMVGHMAAANYIDLAEQAAEIIRISGRKEIAQRIIARTGKGHTPPAPIV